MASVQELLLAANSKAKRSSIAPLLDLLDTGLSGYQTGQGIRDKNVDIATKLLQQEQIRMENEYMKQEAANRAQDTTNALNDATVKKPGVFPTQKITETETRDYKGHTTRSTTKTNADPKELSSFTAEQAAAIKSGDTDAMAKVFPGGIPEKALSLAITASGSGEFVGTQGGKGLIFNNKKRTLNQVDLPGSGPITSKVQTDAQSNASLFAERAAQAHKQLSDLVSSGVDPTSYKIGIEKKILPNALQSSDTQQLEQIKRNFVNAILRKESGAAISPSELSEADKQYFPQAGDSPDVLKQKEINRQTAIEGLNRAAGNSSISESSSTDSPKIQKINSQAQYDALPSGSEYVDSHGKRARKK